jgi:predicted Rossmann fold nucleotide-binding protein DprA/Smf involved in DNA uptake
MELKFVTEADTARDVLAMLRDQADNVEAPATSRLATADNDKALHRASPHDQCGRALRLVPIAEHEDRANTEVSADQVIATLLAGEEQAAVIARKLDAPLPMVRAHLVALEADGRAMRSGQKRGTKWHPKPRPAHPGVR